MLFSNNVFCPRRQLPTPRTKKVTFDLSLRNQRQAQIASVSLWHFRLVATANAKMCSAHSGKLAWAQLSKPLGNNGLSFGGTQQAPE